MLDYYYLFLHCNKLPFFPLCVSVCVDLNTVRRVTIGFLETQKDDATSCKKNGDDVNGLSIGCMYSGSILWFYTQFSLVE